MATARPVSRQPWLVAAAVIAVLALLAWLFWPLGSRQQHERIVQTITLVTPPPPPPPVPEEQIMEKEPELVEPTETPQPQTDVEQPSEQPSDEAPSEAPSTEAAGLDKPADAGSDSFRLAAGKGGGLFGRGGGGGGGGWGAFVETHIRRALQRDPRTRSAQGFLNIVVTIDPDGRFVDARLRSTTADAALDKAITEVLGTLPPLGRGLPPQQNGRTYATINMKRSDG